MVEVHDDTARASLFGFDFETEIEVVSMVGATEPTEEDWGKTLARYRAALRTTSGLPRA